MWTALLGVFNIWNWKPQTFVACRRLENRILTVVYSSGISSLCHSNCNLRLMNSCWNKEIITVLNLSCIIAHQSYFHYLTFVVLIYYFCRNRKNSLRIKMRDNVIISSVVKLFQNFNFLFFWICALMLLYHFVYYAIV